MDKLTNALHTQMPEEKQKLWQMIKEKGNTGVYECYKQTTLERQKIAKVNGEAVKVTISEEGMKSYRERITNGQSFEEVQAQRKRLLESNLSPDINYKFTLSEKVNSLNEADKKSGGIEYLSNEEKLDNIMEAYKSLYEEIVYGYESGKRVINVADETSEKGYRTLSMQEELADLDHAYENAVNTAVSIMGQSEKAAVAFDKYYAKIQRIGVSRAELANAYANQRNKMEAVPENAVEKMISKRDAWKLAFTQSLASFLR